MKRSPSRRPPFQSRGIDAYLEELIPDAREALDAWPLEDQARFHEQLEDAASALQRELLGRSLAAGHDIAALHAFADALRPLSDQEAFSACTLDSGGASGARTVVARLRAEADPLFAFESNGHMARPLGEDEAGSSVIAPRGAIPASLLVPTPLYARPSRPSFDEESRIERPLARTRDPVAQERTRPGSAQGTGRAWAAELYSEALKPLGIAYREELLDTQGFTLEKALDRVSEALGRNLLVPATIGPDVGELRKDVLFLQVQPAGKSRSFQLHDPFGGETVWVHEKDLLARLELPFKDKRNRRVTAVSLPSAR